MFITFWGRFFKCRDLKIFDTRIFDVFKTGKRILSFQKDILQKIYSRQNFNEIFQLSR